MTTLTPKEINEHLSANYPPPAPDPIDMTTEYPDYELGGVRYPIINRPVAFYTEPKNVADSDYADDALNSYLADELRSVEKCGIKSFDKFETCRYRVDWIAVTLFMKRWHKDVERLAYSAHRIIASRDDKMIALEFKLSAKGYSEVLAKLLEQR